MDKWLTANWPQVLANHFEMTKHCTMPEATGQGQPNVDIVKGCISTFGAMSNIILINLQNHN